MAERIAYAKVAPDVVKAMRGLEDQLRRSTAPYLRSTLRARRRGSRPGGWRDGSQNGGAI